MSPAAKKSSARNGLDALLTPHNSALILIDHQPFQFANVRNIDPTLVLNNTIGLAKGAKAFGVPTILTTVVQDRGGFLPKELQNVFPDQKPIDRTTINTWEDPRVVKAVEKTGRKKLVIAALDGSLPRHASHPCAGRRLRRVCRNGRFRRRQRRSPRARHSTHGAGGCCSHYMDGRVKRVAARLGARSDCASARRNHAGTRWIYGDELRVGTPAPRRVVRQKVSDDNS